MSQRNIFYYDNRDNLSCVRDPDLGLTYYTYDGLSRMTSVKNPHGEVTYYEYTPGGQVKQKILGNGAVSYYEYDAARRVSRIEHRKSDLTEIATLDYEYDRVGNPTKITREDGSATYYDYDGIYQLTGETQVGSGGVEYAFEYDYDGAHNRTVKVVDGVPTYYAYNEANELLTETTGGETTYYHYDGRGNTVAKQEAAGTTYYHYDTENLMTRIDFAGGSSYYDYDADSKRVSQRTADGYRQFVYQGPDMLKLQLERDESEETVAHYTMGAGLEAMRRDSASSFYHYNHLGTALALTGADEAVTDTYRHDAWGVLLASTGSTVNPHTYVGRERYYRMPSVAMYHLGFRDYAQGLGRFTTVDPVALQPAELARVLHIVSTLPESLSLTWDLSKYTGLTRATASGRASDHLYVRNRPSAWTDPSGELPPLAAVIGTIAKIIQALIAIAFLYGFYVCAAAAKEALDEVVELRDRTEYPDPSCVEGAEESRRIIRELVSGDAFQKMKEACADALGEQFLNFPWPFDWGVGTDGGGEQPEGSSH
jgi:YD repeat-containing protein